MDCRICNSALPTDPAFDGVLDYEHGIETHSRFFQCSHCGTLSLDADSAALDPSSLYPVDYRPHSRSPLFLALKRIQSELFLHALKRYLPSKDEPVLELGCGAGQLLLALRRRGFSRLFGADRNRGAQADLSSNGIGFIQGELATVLARPEKYACIILGYVLEHSDNPHHLLQQCRDALTETGRVLVLTPSSESWSALFFGKYWAGLHAPRHIEIFTPRSLRLLGEKAGLHTKEQTLLLDPGSWAVSFQNFLRGRSGKKQNPGRGTAWVTYFALVFFFPLALLEKISRRGSAILCVLQPA